MSFTDFNYIPILGVRPAEMRALEELSAHTKDVMLPYIVLQPWLAANELASTVARVNATMGVRPIIADIVAPTIIKGKRRPVHDAFDELRNSHDGFRNYIDFVSDNENFIPSMQLADLSQLNGQIGHLVELDRGAVVRLQEPMLQFAGDIAERLEGHIPGQRIHFIIDFEKQNRDLLLKATIALRAVRAIRRSLPDSSVSFSASTFPDSFVGLDHQDIFEREFFNIMDQAINGENIIYCDRGSTRAEALGGGGGQPAPRIDLASVQRWNFFRVDDADDKVEGFRTAAANAVNANCWNDIGIWGTEYIKRTTDEEETDIIDTAAKCTAARINIHLHVQAMNGIEAENDSDEWSD